MPGPAAKPTIPQPHTVGTIMTRRVVTASGDDTLAQVKRIFEQRGFHYMVVVDHGRVTGLVSDRDLFRSLSPFVGRRTEREQDANSLNRKVHQFMTRRVITCTESMPIAEAGKLMLEKGLSCLPVVDGDGGCVGILTTHDLLAWCMVRCAGAGDTCALPRAA